MFDPDLPGSAQPVLQRRFSVDFPQSLEHVFDTVMSLADLQHEAANLSVEERLRLAVFLTSLDREERAGADRPRVSLPLIPCLAGTVIDPTKAELDASLWG